MKKASLIAILMLFYCTSQAQDEPLKQLLDRQILALNTQDIDAMIDNVSDDFKYYFITNDQLILQTDGKADFKTSMLKYFNAVQSPHSEIVSHTIHANRISFKEVISYKNNLGESKSASAMGIYQYKEDKIFRAWYFVDASQ